MERPWSRQPTLSRPSTHPWEGPIQLPVSRQNTLSRPSTHPWEGPVELPVSRQNTFSGSGFLFELQVEQEQEPEPPPRQPPKALYEVSTGLVAVRKGPSTFAESLGVLKGGHRFYATPCRIEGKIWLKLQTEDLPPPLFSPSNHNARSLSVGHDKHYVASVPRLFSQPASPWAEDAFLEPEGPDEAWVRNEDQCIILIRRGKGEKFRRFGEVWPSEVAPQGCSIADLKQLSKSQSSTPKSDQQAQVSRAGSQSENSISSSLAASIYGAEQRFMAGLSRSLSRSRSSPTIDRDAWSGCGPGPWVNTRRYGVAGSPPNMNCGRWRQLPE